MTIQGKFDKYDLGIALRKKGKFGNTFTGTNNSNGEKVIIKSITSSNAIAIKRFSREVEINIDHPNLSKTIEYFKIEDDHYLIREFIPGTDLKTYSQKRKPHVTFFIQCGIQIANALAALHEEDIIHRDVRPANIIVSEDGDNFKLIDLGLTKLPTDDPKERSPFAMIYSPPEQIMNCGEVVNVTSDIYALGVSLYECMTGEIPFQHDHPEMMMQIMINVPLQPNKRVPKELFEIILKATSKHKFPLPPNRYKRSEVLKMMLKGQEGRYQNVAELRADLEMLL